MALSDVKVRNVKPGVKQVKLSDGEGMYLLVTPTGGKCWRLKYRFGGKEKTLALGTYPAIALSEARLRKDEAKKQLANNVDPSEVKKAQKISKFAEQANSLEVVAREWHRKHSDSWSESHALTTLRRLETNVFPMLGGRPIADIRPPELLLMLQRIESRGALETAHRVRTICSQVLCYAVATGRAERDFTIDLKGALPPYTTRHHPAITDPKEVAGLLKAIDGYKGTLVVRAALQLAPMVFLRPGELRHAEWAEFDLDAAEWNVPVERLKMKVSAKRARKGELHLIPLSQQGVEILRELQVMTGRGKYVFPCQRSMSRCMSENAVNAALKRMGYDKDTMTGHGFRAMCRTLLDEILNFPPDIIDHQLTHAVRDPNGRAYNRTTFKEQRIAMVQAWADYLDKLKSTD